MHRIRQILPSLAVLCGLLLAAPSAADDKPETDERFAAVAEFAGYCWIGPFPGSEARDLHCWEWILDGEFLRDSHRVMGGEGPYAGETLYGPAVLEIRSSMVREDDVSYSVVSE